MVEYNAVLGSERPPGGRGKFTKSLLQDADEAERASQEAVGDAVEARRAGRPIVVARDGKPVTGDLKTVRM